MTFLVVLTSHIEKFIYSPKIKNLYDDTQYRRCQLFLPIPIRPTTDCSNNRPDYTYGRCIGTALHVYLICFALINHVCIAVLILVCIGTSNGMSHEINGNRYSNYSNHYRGCNVVDGNLEVVFLGNGSASYDMSFLKDIEEVTGYVLIFSVNARIIPLTSLRIIRGKTLFQSGSGTPAYGLYVAYNYMNETNVGLRELQLKSLTGNSFLLLQLPPLPV